MRIRPRKRDHPGLLQFSHLMSGSTRLIGNYLTTDQVLAVGGIQFQSEPLRKRNQSGRTPDASSCYGDDEQMTE